VTKETRQTEGGLEPHESDHSITRITGEQRDQVLLLRKGLKIYYPEWRQYLEPFGVSTAKDLSSYDAARFIEKLRNLRHDLIFREVFKGRRDIVAERWESKEGKSGFAPKCGNKWKEDVCKMPCKTCPNADYINLSGELVRHHFSGICVLGVYPLMADNTCNFVAADFDNHDGRRDPRLDILAFYEVCQVQEIPCYVLKSRSGNGYHAYIFFIEALPAWKARLVAFALLREAQLIGEDIELSSFDRLFPNQDRLTGRGLGNLIALPFQGINRHRNKSVFTVFHDPATEFNEPYEDQWRILRNIERIGEGLLDQVITEWDLVDHSLDMQDVVKEFNQKYKSNYSKIDCPPPDLERVKKGCPFIFHCVVDAGILAEPEWYALLTISARCADGEALSHKLSEPYPGYTREETAGKIEHALNDTGPYTCQCIETYINASFCRECRHYGKVRSPISLGLKKPPLSDVIGQINERHAVLMVGSKFVVLKEFNDPVFNRPDIALMHVSDFKNLYANKRVPDPDASEKKSKLTSAASVWLKSSQRREYGGFVFSPGKDIAGFYNLWKGFAVEPKQGDWSLYRNHIYEVIASNDKERANWLLAWKARIVQNPGGDRPGTSPVLRGKQGTGKGCYASIFGRVIGNHFLHINNQNQLTGRFNNHLKDALMVFCDEGVWAGDKQAEGVIKGMVTEEYIMIEPKGKDSFAVKNHINLIIASNNNWVVPGGLEERRFFCMDVSDSKIGDREYFKAIYNQMENGGLEAMLYDLLTMDISGIDLRRIPRTDALLDQIISSMSSVQKFWFERLRAGTLSVEDREWHAWKKTRDLYGEYLDFAKTIGDRFPLIDKQFTKQLKALCPGTPGEPDSGIKRKRKNLGDERPWILRFPKLETCRTQLERMVGMEIDWHEDGTDNLY
jgi:hypothetical protein